MRLNIFNISFLVLYLIFLIKPLHCSFVKAKQHHVQKPHIYDINRQSDKPLSPVIFGKF